MPVQTQGVKLTCLIKAFLDEALAESRLPGKRHLANARRRPCLADRDQADLSGVTSVLPRRAGDSRENGLQLGGE
jgi:hypothetical protein